jgi:chromate transporter
MADNPYVALAVVLVPISFFAFGGGVSAVPAIQHQAVGVNAWVSAQEFVEMFAVARTAPGPGFMLVTLIGWKLAGWLGALIATLAIFVPPAVLCFAVNSVWTRYQGRQWYEAVAQGLAPVGAGLVGAAAIVLVDLSGGGPIALAASAVTAAVLFLRPKMSPTLALMSMAVLFALGSVFMGV